MAQTQQPILFLQPQLKENIWGGSRLKTDYGYDIPSSHTGECWGISAHPNGDDTIKEGIYAGKNYPSCGRSIAVCLEICRGAVSAAC